ncbi:MAG TPA: amidohydrolase family protein [Dongiaceae bacterium]|jgi:L-fuconolactonase|nr:amidohydrolase family protein [Dongiaceae bacterium]
MRIDAHQHFWQLSRGDYGWLTPELGVIYRDFTADDLRPILQRHKIDATIIVQAAPTITETEFMLNIARRTDFVKGVVGWADFEAKDAPAVIGRLAAREYLVGLRPMIQDIPDPEWMLRPEIAPAMVEMERTHLRFDALLKPPHLEPFKKFLRKYPHLPIVIDHGSKPEIRSGGFGAWAPAMREIAQDERVFCKLSGLITEAKSDWQTEDLRSYIDHLVASFGPSRLMWGSDWPVANLAGGYDRWMEASQACLLSLSGEERAAIFGGTAARFYGVAA